VKRKAVLLLAISKQGNRKGKQRRKQKKRWWRLAGGGSVNWDMWWYLSTLPSLRRSSRSGIWERFDTSFSWGWLVSNLAPYKSTLHAVRPNRCKFAGALLRWLRCKAWKMCSIKFIQKGRRVPYIRRPKKRNNSEGIGLFRFCSQPTRWAYWLRAVKLHSCHHEILIGYHLVGERKCCQVALRPCIQWYPRSCWNFRRTRLSPCRLKLVESF
jgi:hypothetical protein